VTIFVTLIDQDLCTSEEILEKEKPSLEDHVEGKQTLNNKYIYLINTVHLPIVYTCYH